MVTQIVGYIKGHYIVPENIIYKSEKNLLDIKQKIWIVKYLSLFYNVCKKNFPCPNFQKFTTIKSIDCYSLMLIIIDKLVIIAKNLG